MTRSVNTARSALGNGEQGDLDSLDDVETHLLDRGRRLPPSEVERQKTLSSTSALEREFSRQGRFATKTGPERRRFIAPRIRPGVSAKPEKFVPLEGWEGVVESVSDGSFGARVLSMDLLADEETVELPLREVSDEDLRLVEPGAVFYWTIGYAITRGGQRRRESLLRFRRIPTVTASEDRVRGEWVAEVAKNWLP
ncbi:hypothetical protein GCM10023204_40910 [Actinomycetospora succinea]